MNPNQPDDPFLAGLRLAQAFDRFEVPYALGEALAFGMWAIPRATIAIDVNVFVTDDKLIAVFEAMESLGISLDRNRAAIEADTDGMLPSCPIDLQGTIH